MKPDPYTLQDAIKKYSHDQDKIISPHETVRRFKQRLTQTGLDILEDVVRIDNGRLGIPVYFSICGPDAYKTIGNYKQMGKGATPDQSQASAVMELGERFSLFSYIANPSNFVVSTKDALKETSLGFNWIMRSVDDRCDEPAIAEKLFNQIPLQWTWAQNITTGEPVMIPFNWFFTINEFNGSCAGNCNEEAICQGICEVVERHVCAVISGERMVTPRIETDSIKDPIALDLISRFTNNGIQLYLNDFTSDMGIPSVGALAWDPSTFPEKSEIIWTAGTAPDPHKALCRTLTEIAQLAGDFNSGGNYVASGLPKFHDPSHACFVTHPSIRCAIDSLPNLGDPNIKTEINNCIKALSRKTMDVFIVDVQHPELKIPAFYTIIPGTRFRERSVNADVAMISGKIITETLPAAQAMSHLKAWDKALPGKYYLNFYMGQLYIMKNEYAEATRHFHQALDQQPPTEDKAAIFTYLGICHKEQEHYQEALSVLEQAVDLDNERTDTLNLLGFCYFKIKAHDKAIDCFSRLIALNPSSAIDYANLAVNYRAIGDKTKAIAYYQLALTLDSQIDFARRHLTELGVDL